MRTNWGGKQSRLRNTLIKEELGTSSLWWNKRKKIKNFEGRFGLNSRGNQLKSSKKWQNVKTFTFFIVRGWDHWRMGGLPKQLRQVVWGHPCRLCWLSQWKNSLMHFGKHSGVEVDCSTKSHPELAGEGIEYSWGRAKCLQERKTCQNNR